MKLTENFTFEEMIDSATAKAKGINNTPNQKETENITKLCETILQPIRNKYGKPITVTSGFRCEKLNKAVGGVPTSQHRFGEAADIICASNKQLWNVITEMIRRKEITVGQLINEKNLSWIHISLPTKTKNNQILSLK